MVALQYQPNAERIFYQTLIEAIPFLFLAPVEFRNTLSNKLERLYFQYKNENAGSSAQFANDITEINTLIAEARDRWDSHIQNQIGAFRGGMMTFEERITALEKVVREKKIVKVTKPRGHVKPEIVKPEIVKPEIVKPEIVKPEIVKPDVTTLILDTKQPSPKRILNYIASNPGETSSQIVAGSGENPNCCRRDLTVLFQRGLVTRDGERCAYRYYPGENYNPTRVEINGHAEKIVSFVNFNPGGGLAGISEGTGIPMTTCQPYVSKLCSEGKIRKEGSVGKYRYYPLTLPTGGETP